MATYFQIYMKALIEEAKNNLSAFAKSYAPNKHLRGSIKSESKSAGENKFQIIVKASGPDAAASEHGSGLWATREERRKYSILPRNKPLLVFKWDATTSPFSGREIHVPRDKNNIVHLKKVEHPGIEAANNGRGFLYPAAQDTKRDIVENIKTDVVAAIKIDIREAFVVKK